MKTTRIMLAIGLFAAMSMLMAACGAELNPKFESSLNNALDAKNGEFKACYEAALEKDREAKGLMNLDIEFKADSKKAKDASVKKSEISGGGIKKCVVGAAKGVETTELPGVPVTGKYKIDFNFE